MLKGPHLQFMRGSFVTYNHCPWVELKCTACPHMADALFDDMTERTGFPQSVDNDQHLFCKRCGKTVTPKKVMDGVDVCSRCRVRK